VGFGSTSTAPTLTPEASRVFAARFRVGASCLQWPHHGA